MLGSYCDALSLIRNIFSFSCRKCVRAGAQDRREVQSGAATPATVIWIIWLVFDWFIVPLVGTTRCNVVSANYQPQTLLIPRQCCFSDYQSNKSIHCHANPEPGSWVNTSTERTLLPALGSSALELPNHITVRHLLLSGSKQVVWG